ncbi:MAG: RnfABCDGE type electron transport complex subunit B [bacterium]|jgi:Na+-translocating ferredoxin:NAD+ oxidoreductase RNF subunit RnfB|nr:RnfABCDGE type electron transport complex subunit B [bacterium]
MLAAVLTLAVLGGIFGIGLGIAQRKFAVHKDPKVEQVEGLLPQANCGACGFTGCSLFAEAVVGDSSLLPKCIPGQGASAAIAAVLGVEAGDAMTRVVARLVCRGSRIKAKSKYTYTGIEDCLAAMQMFDGPKECRLGCLGLGRCAAVCPFGAIVMNENGLPDIDPDLCTGCGKCIEGCPRNVLVLMPPDRKIVVACRSTEKGKIVIKACKVGCIGCGKCAKVCPTEAIKVDNKLAVIDYAGCVECGACVAACPTKAIVFEVPPNRMATIDPETCTGCTLCARSCPLKAITGEKKEAHVIDFEKCVGCGICVDKCPKESIKLCSRTTNIST